MERPVLSENQIENNVRGIGDILTNLLTHEHGTGPSPMILNNLVSAPSQVGAVNV